MTIYCIDINYIFDWNNLKIVDIAPMTVVSLLAPCTRPCSILQYS